MANKKHLTLLNLGAKAWNWWRRIKTSILPDLSGADLRRANLRGANLIGVNLSGANLDEANLSRANLTDANVREGYVFLPNLSEATLSWTNLIEANLREVDLFWANLSGAKLNRANLSMADLRWANLRGADLTQADLRFAKLIGANLSGANLSRANFRWAHLCGANLSRADLSRANLIGADLRGAVLSAADLFFTVFTATDLSVANGLETVQHYGPSTIGLDTILKSKGKIPGVFLLGAGVPDIFIKYMASLTGQAFEFYSCFISYSNKDQEFAERLFVDLQSKGVRCWFAPENLKIDDKFPTTIGETVRVYDKLLLVLSEHSVHSSWVEKEVEMAMEKETEQERPVLFPIRLDDAVMNLKTGWPADIRRTRHIGDFRDWKTHDAYQQALDRLLRDLKAEIKTATT